MVRGFADYFIDAAAQRLCDEHAIRFGLEDFQMIERIDLASFDFVLNYLAPAKIRIAITPHQLTSAFNQQNPARVWSWTVHPRGSKAHR